MRLFGKKIAPVAPPMNRDVPAKCLRRIFFGCAMSASPHGNGFAREDGRGREPSARGSRLRVFLFLGPVSAGGETGKAGPFLQRVQGSPAALPRRRRRWAPSFRRRSRHRRCQAIRGGRHVCRVWKACPAFGRTLFNDHPKRLITIPAINRLNGCCIVWLPA